MKRFLNALVLATIAALLGPSGVAASVRLDGEETVFRIDGVSAAKVFLVGDFNGWNPTIDMLEASDGGFEIRLYLLPGRYRYRFIVDGVSMSDPDNPFIDSEGNSCFVLVERNGAMEIILSDRIEARGEGLGEETMLSAKARMVVVEDRAVLFGAGDLRGTGGERTSADLGIALSANYPEGGAVEGVSFFLRGNAAYRFDRGTLAAFSRSGSVGLGDPLSLFTLVGPFRYPLGLFCRGLSFEGRFPFGVDGSAFYASRLEGYRSGLEAGASASGLFAKRDPVDADLIGAKLGASIGRLTARYLFRQDRRPKDGAWRLPGIGDALFKGFERARFQGFWMTLAGSAGLALDGEFLCGASTLEVTEEALQGDEIFHETSFERRWEQGRRLLIGIARNGEKSTSKASVSQTTLEGDRAMRDGRSDGSRTVVEGSFERRGSYFTLAVRGAFEDYSASNTGAVFWLGRTNFWLDGDEVSIDRISFLSARQISDYGLLFTVKGDTLVGLSRGNGLRLSIVQRQALTGDRALFREIGLSKGLRIVPRVSLLVDMRGISYRYGERRRDFVDAFLMLHGRIDHSTWCSLGCGVNPYAFDRWLFEPSDHGRADYLIDHGVFRALTEQGESVAMDALFDAEESLAGDFMVTFEAGYAF